MNSSKVTGDPDSSGVDLDSIDVAAGTEPSGNPASMAGLEATGLAAWMHRPAGTSATGGPIASRLGQMAWAMYEWARIPYVLLVTIYLFAPYFTTTVVGDPVKGQQLWAAFSSYGGFATAIAAPFLGAVADVGGRRKPWIAVYTLIMAVSMCLMWRAQPHSSWNGIIVVGILVAVTNFSYEFSSVFHSAMLPTIAPHNRVGPLSGLGLSLGNLAGILMLATMMLLFSLPGKVDWSFVPAHPWFGVSQAAHDPERLSGPISGVWLLIFAIPLFLFTPDRPSVGLGITHAVTSGAKSVWRTILSLGHYRNIAHYLGARMLFNDGMTAVLTFGGIYAAGTFHWGALPMIMYGLELSVFAVAGGFMAGWLDNNLGSKRALFVSIGGTLLFFALSLTMAPDRILWFIHYDTTLPPINALPFFNSWPQVIFLAIVNGVAVFITAGYANARTMMARLAPPEKMTEFFGLMALSGTSTTFLANVAVTFMTAYTSSQRGGMLAVLVFLIAGLIWMAFVNEERAVAL